MQAPLLVQFCIFLMVSMNIRYLFYFYHYLNIFLITEIDGAVFYITIEGKVVTLHDNDFRIAVAKMFALFYVFNLSYPKGSSLCLEFLQRYLFKIHPYDGTRSTKRTYNNCSMKVLTLLKKIN